MAGRMNFEEFCNRVVQEINQEKALGAHPLPSQQEAHHEPAI